MIRAMILGSVSMMRQALALPTIQNSIRRISLKKHQASNLWLKPTIRILKNMRTKLAEDGVLEAKTAPSYYLEGLLYNVPDDQFTTDYEDCFVNAINWIQKPIRANSYVRTSNTIFSRTIPLLLRLKQIAKPFSMPPSTFGRIGDTCPTAAGQPSSTTLRHPPGGQPEPRAIGLLLIVPTIRSREVASTQRSSVRHGKEAL
jgi:hypothetical protein